MTNPVELDRLRVELAGENAALRLTAAEKLMTTPVLARMFAPELLKLCATGEESLREVVVGAIEGMGPPEPAVAAGIAPFLSGDELQSYWAATLLGRLGKDAAFAAAELAKALSESPRPVVRERCAWALGQMGPSAKDALPALEQAAASASPRLARFAKEAIASLGGD